ncbi:MAG TPA: prepilin-type cleavage/methylation domain-containing protein, partial [Nitrosomonas nitrosa]|nr:prepilin-type N-terminal cleavage/methylation domain-containing protein [Nitrosomonas nitrosa]HBZ30374.1 prepilin-type cleavage/methylation domain-containing protein [Nitrosomonas nitrosa]
MKQMATKQQGFTLVELMIAMTIGLILLGGVITILTSSQQVYRVNDALARMQENARYAFQVL